MLFCAIYITATIQQLYAAAGSFPLIDITPSISTDYVKSPPTLPGEGGGGDARAPCLCKGFCCSCQPHFASNVVGATLSDAPSSAWVTSTIWLTSTLVLVGACPADKFAAGGARCRSTNLVGSSDP